MDTQANSKSLRLRLRDTERNLQQYQSEISQLQSEAERLRVLFEYAPDGYYLIDFSGNFVDGNRVAAELVGYDREELIGKNLFELNLLSADQLESAIALFEQNLKGNPTGPDIFSLSRKDGSAVPIEISTYPYMHKGGAVVLGLARDISERLQSQQALSRSEARFRTVVNDSPIGIAIYDEHFFPLHANKKFVDLFGLSDLSAIRNISLLDDVKIPPEKKKELVISKSIRFETVFDFGKLKKRQLFQSSHDGICHFDVHISRFGHGDDAPGELLIHVQDISKRKAAQEELLAAHHRLEQEVKDRTANLRETNTALKIVLNERQHEKKTFKESTLFNLRELALPILEQLKNSSLVEHQQQLVDALESTLSDIMTPLIKESSLEKLPLTRTELHVANLIKQGLNTREIARIFDASPRTIERHRDNLRKKLGLTNRKQNLRSFLLSMNNLDATTEPNL